MGNKNAKSQNYQLVTPKTRKNCVNIMDKHGNIHGYLTHNYSFETIVINDFLSSKLKDCKKIPDNGCICHFFSIERTMDL
jgi:hypothetical protein